jgi:hypothetical protein
LPIRPGWGKSIEVICAKGDSISGTSTLGALWGVGGVLAVLGYAAFRLTYPAIEAYSYNLEWYHWGLLALNMAVVAYAKAYRGFQKGLSPRIAARARYLRDNPTITRVLLAPLYCLGYFDTERPKQISMIILTFTMAGLILLVRLLQQPWRGILDTGIAAGLAWGFLTLSVYSVRALILNRDQ